MIFQKLLYNILIISIEYIITYLHNINSKHIVIYSVSFTFQAHHIQKINFLECIYINFTIIVYMLLMIE